MRNKARTSRSEHEHTSASARDGARDGAGSEQAPERASARALDRASARAPQRASARAPERASARAPGRARRVSRARWREGWRGHRLARCVGASDGMRVGVNVGRRGRRHARRREGRCERRSAQTSARASARETARGRRGACARVCPPVRRVRRVRRGRALARAVERVEVPPVEGEGLIARQMSLTSESGDDRTPPTINDPLARETASHHSTNVRRTATT